MDQQAHDFSFMAHTAALWARGGASLVSAATTLRKLCVNVLDSPGVLRYRRVRTAKVDGLLPEAVLVHCGFSTVTYPDGTYWVMQKVDEALLRSVVKELDIGIATAERFASRPSPSVSETAPRPSSPEASAPPESPDASAAAVQEATPVEEATAVEEATVLQRLQASAREAPSLETQLRARSAAHKFAAAHATGPSASGRAVGAACTAGLALLAAWYLRD